MKLKEVVFPRPVKVVQTWSNTYLYTKGERSFSDRKEIVTWDIRSKQGYVADGKLYLPEVPVEDMNLEHCRLITIDDHNYTRQKDVFKFHERQNYGSNTYVDLYAAGAEDFVLAKQHSYLDPTRSNGRGRYRLNEEGTLELYNTGSGFPWRKDFKICDLDVHQPVEVKLNFKSFNPLQGPVRFLEENTTIYEYLGDFDRCYFLREPLESINKAIPPGRKVVNLLKPLWM